MSKENQSNKYFNLNEEITTYHYNFNVKKELIKKFILFYNISRCLISRYMRRKKINYFRLIYYRSVANHSDLVSVTFV